MIATHFNSLQDDRNRIQIAMYEDEEQLKTHAKITLAFNILNHTCNTKVQEVGMYGLIIYMKSKV